MLITLDGTDPLYYRIQCLKNGEMVGGLVGVDLDSLRAKQIIGRS